jgi:hypothetical protein
MTNIKISNILSYFHKDGIISVKNETEIIKEKIRLITTGVKYEKERETPINNINYSITAKSNKFNLLNYVSNRVKIKYITPKNNIRKITVEHLRKGHYRTYKDGRQIWISETIINEDVA